MKIKISPSILSADFSKLGDECTRLCRCGADMIHIDVMDGNFVPNISIGAPVIRCIKPLAGIPLDVHLMISRPERLICDFINSGADLITVHAEATDNIEEIIRTLHKHGVKAAVSIKPETPVEAVYPYLGELDMVLVMTVEPGFGGQKLIEKTISKITKLKSKCDCAGISMDIEVDGGITCENISRLSLAGANVFVAGSAVFGAENMAAAVSSLRQKAQLI